LAEHIDQAVRGCQIGRICKQQGGAGHHGEAGTADLAFRPGRPGLAGVASAAGALNGAARAGSAADGAARRESLRDFSGLFDDAGPARADGSRRLRRAPRGESGRGPDDSSDEIRKVLLDIMLIIGVR
jgi:hypothetical protein